MPTISDPTRLSREELLAEWSVREEELRLQFESINTAQAQAQLLLQRYERMFAYCPLPMLVIDSRARVQEANRAARNLLGTALDASTGHLPEILDDAARLALSQALRSLSAADAAVAEHITCGLRERGEGIEALLVALDAQRPPDTYALMFMTGGPEAADD